MNVVLKKNRIRSKFNRFKRHCPEHSTEVVHALWAFYKMRLIGRKVTAGAFSALKFLSWCYLLIKNIFKKLLKIPQN